MNTHNKKAVEIINNMPEDESVWVTTDYFKLDYRSEDVAVDKKWLVGYIERVDLDYHVLLYRNEKLNDKIIVQLYPYEDGTDWEKTFNRVCDKFESHESESFVILNKTAGEEEINEVFAEECRQFLNEHKDELCKRTFTKLDNIHGVEEADEHRHQYDDCILMFETAAEAKLVDRKDRAIWYDLAVCLIWDLH